MKNLLIIILSVFIISCESKQDLKDDISLLEKQKLNLETEILVLNRSIDTKSDIVLKLNEDFKILNKYKNGNTPKFILTFKLKQSHFSLSIGKHVKDNMNAIEFEIPVDKEYYDSVEEGTNIVDKFRYGSLFLNGSFGDWKMKVIKKEIR